MGMMGAAGTGQNDGRRGHTPAGYLTNATNTSEIIGEPVKVAPAVLGRKPLKKGDLGEQPAEPQESYSPQVIGRKLTSSRAEPE